VVTTALCDRISRATKLSARPMPGAQLKVNLFGSARQIGCWWGSRYQSNPIAAVAIRFDFHFCVYNVMRVLLTRFSAKASRISCGRTSSRILSSLSARCIAGCCYRHSPTTSAVTVYQLQIITLILTTVEFADIIQSASAALQ
jgi:hypothetical protein